MNFGVRQLSLAFSKLLSICDTKTENEPIQPATPVAPAPSVRPAASIPRATTVSTPKVLISSSSPASGQNMAESEGPGIIVFTLWYIAIAISYAMENYFKPKERNESETNTEVFSVDQIIPKTQEAVHSPSFFTAVPPLFTPMQMKPTISDTMKGDPEPEQKSEAEPQSPKVVAASEDSFVEASAIPVEEQEPLVQIISDFVAESAGEEGIGNFESNQEFLHEEIPDAQIEEHTEQVFDIED